MFGGQSTQERREANRKLTSLLVQEDPTVIELLPRVKLRQPGGGFKSTDGPPREPQTFKVIFQKSTTIGSSIEDTTGVSSAGGNQIHEYDFLLLGEWDADIAIGDQWTDEYGQNWVIGGFQPNNGYEVRAGAKSYGGNPHA